MTPNGVDTVRETISAIHQDAASALGRSDLDRLMAVYADDIVMLPPNQPARVGRLSVREMWEQLLGAYEARVSVRTEEVECAGEWAFERGSFDMTLLPKGGGDAVQDSGKYLDILRRQPDGTWRYWRICFNSSKPAAS